MMVRTIFSFVLLTFVLVGQPGFAASLFIDPPDQTVGIGDKTNTAIFIWGLGNNVSPSLRGFDITITYDPSIISFDSASFGPWLGDPNNSSATWKIIHSTPPDLQLAQVSFLASDVLIQYQPSVLKLANVTFSGDTTGNSPINFSDVALIDEVRKAITIEELDEATIRVVPIPIPSTLVLLGFGLASVWGAKRRKKAVM